jgi:hypothetical protein
MDRNTSRRRTVGISSHLGPSGLVKPHDLTITDIAIACLALDYGYSAWFSHQIDEVIARDEEANLATDGRLPHNDHHGS